MRWLLQKFHGLSAFLLAVLLSCVITLPGIFFLNTKLLGEGGDTYQYLGFQSLVKLQLQAGRYPFSWTTAWRYPGGFDFGRGYDSILSNLYGGTLSLILGNATLAYNLTILSSLVFNALCGYTFFYTLTHSKRLATLGMIGFGLSFYNIARATGHANLLLTGAFALVAASVLQLWRRRHTQLTHKDYLFVTLSLTLLGLSSAQYFIMAGICLLLSLGIGCLAYWPGVLQLVRRVLRDWKKVTVSSIPLIVMFALVFFPLLLAIKEGDFAWKTDGDYSPFASDFIMPDPFLRTPLSQQGPLSWEARNIEHVVFMGWIELTLLVLSLFWVVRKNQSLALFAGGSFLLYLVFSFGIKNPETGLVLPYNALINLYPFAAISEPSRFIILANLFLLILVVLYLQQHKLHTKNALIGALLIGMLVERISWGGYAMVDPVGGKYIPVVQSQPGKAVFDIPLYDARYDSNAELYGKAIVAGYMHWLGDTNKTRAFINYNDELTRFDCNTQLSSFEGMRSIATQQQRDFELQKNQIMLSRLRENDVRTIVLHKDYQYNWTGCSNVVAQKTFLFPAITLAKPTGFRERMVQMRWAGQSTQQAALFFPQAGTVKILSLHFSPKADATTFAILLNDQPLDSNQWSYGPDTNLPNSFWTSPIDKERTFEVAAGSTLRFATQNYQEAGFATVYYTYEVTDPHSARASLQFNGLEKIYEDENKEVYSIL